MPAPPVPVLVLDDDPDIGVAARLLLQRRVGPVAVLQRPADLALALDRDDPAVLLLDMNFEPGRTDGEQGLALLRRVLARPRAPAVVVMTAYADIDLAVRAVKAGAFDFVTKPWNNARLVAVVSAAAAGRAEAPPSDAPDAADDEPLLGDSIPMRRLRETLAAVAPTEASVLVLGERGTAKALVARSLHARSPRAAGPFHAVDPGALPEDGFEHALDDHLQAARGGTLFLDEPGTLSLAHQARLLAVLDRGRAIDVRLVSATGLDERALFDPRAFRADLLYRLNTIVLRVPPLRERRDDILPLAARYLAAYALQHGKPPRTLSPGAVDRLLADDWPGNDRALRHACERAVLLGAPGRLEAADFDLHQAPGGDAVADDGTGADVPGTLRLDERERAAVAEALRSAQGNVSQAARLLGVSRAALYRRIGKHGL